MGHQAEPRGPGRGATAGRRAPEPRAEAQAAAPGQGCAAHRRHEDAENTMAAQLRKDTTANEDLSPITWSFADEIVEQLIPKPEEQKENGKQPHRPRYDPAYCGV